MQRRGCTRCTFVLCKAAEAADKGLRWSGYEDDSSGRRTELKPPDYGVKR